MATLQIRFSGIEPPYESIFSAKSWSLPVKCGSFVSLPETTQTISISPRSLFSTNPGDSTRMPVSLSDAQIWGIGKMDQIFYAKGASVDGFRFCLRFIFRAEEALEKDSENYELYMRLVRDAQFSSRHLWSTMGLITPMHYGLFVMETGDWAGRVVFSLTQWCGLPWTRLMMNKYNTEANRLLIARTWEQLHDTGIELNGMDTHGQLRHILLDLSDPNLDAHLTGRLRCYIAGFSDAALHSCDRKLPLLPLGSSLLGHQFGCDELTSLSVFLGFMNSAHWCNFFCDYPMPSSPPDAAFAASALAWYDEYAQRHPRYSGYHVRLAQRKRLFPGYTQPYSGLTASFQDTEDEYSPLVVHRGASEICLEEGIAHWSRDHLALALNIRPRTNLAPRPDQ